MKAILSIAYHSLKNHGPKMVFKRFYKYAIVKTKRVFSKPDLENIEKWKSLKGKYEGKRVFVIGNGPSLNKTPLYLLKNEYTFCFNRINLMFERNGWAPNFYMITDDLVIRDLEEEVNTEILPNVDYGFFPDIHPYNINFQKYVKKRDNVLWIKTDKPGFTTNLPECGINNTVVNAGLQIMAYLGFKEIYLLGVDASIAFTAHNTSTENNRELTSQADDPNHFDPRYFGKGKKYHYQPMYEMVEKFKIARLFLEEQGIKIRNTGYDPQLNAFERQNLLDVLNYDDKTKEQLFLETVAPGTGAVSFNEFVKDAVHITEVAAFDPNADKVYITGDEGVKLVPKSILTHVPYGPFNGSYVLIKRAEPIVL